MMDDMDKKSDLFIYVIFSVSDYVCIKIEIKLRIGN